MMPILVIVAGLDHSHHSLLRALDRLHALEREPIHIIAPAAPEPLQLPPLPRLVDLIVRPRAERRRNCRRFLPQPRWRGEERGWGLA